MITVLKKGLKKEAISKVLEHLPKKKGFNSKKHNGVIHLKESPVAIQKKMRDEWE
jgi:hypothetical protein